ncbi:MAG: chorismate synthase, partial [bacterium]
VLRIGAVVAQANLSDLPALAAAAEASDLRCADADAATKMRAIIDEAKSAGDTLGGIFQVVVTGLPVGLGSHVHWDRRLDGVLGAAVLSIPAIKGVEFGMGFGVAELLGSQVHDAMYPAPGGVMRTTNNAGGLEGGMTNGEPLLLQAAMKPIPTLVRPLPSVDLATGAAVSAHAERSDVCAVAAAGVVAEAMVAFTLAAQIIAQYGGDQLAEIKARVKEAQL